jgi:predicted permease
MLPHLFGDLCHAARRLSSTPGFTAAAVITIALGVGINTGLFSVLNGVAFRDLPAPDADELVSIHQIIDERTREGRQITGSSNRFSTSDYRAYRDGTQTLQGILAYSYATAVTLGGDSSVVVTGGLVTCNYFDVLRHAPALGPGFASDCDAEGAVPTVVLSHDLWTTAFGADPGIVGREVLLNRQSFAVVGVAPEGVRGLDFVPASFFAPISAQPVLDPGPVLDGDMYRCDNCSWLVLLGRKAPGASLEQVRAELAVIAARLGQARPLRGTTLAIDRARQFSNFEAREELFAVSAVIMAAFGLVLLIACANVANLLLARATSRAREIAVRLSLGASRARIVQQLLAESLLLALLGGVLGSLLAVWTVQGLVLLAIGALPPQAPAMALDTSPDARVLVFALVASVLSGIVFGLAPALQASKADLHVATKGGVAGAGRRSGARLQGTLVGLQVAVCMVLMIATGLLLRGLAATQTVDPGFEYENVAVATLDLRGAGYDEPRAAAFQRELVERVGALPGVEAVAQAMQTPLYTGNFTTMARPSEQDQMVPLRFNTVSPTYFSLTGIPIVRGQAFTSVDFENEPGAVIVTEATARRLWPGQDPIGQTIEAVRLDLAALAAPASARATRRVVGVAKDAQITAIGEIPSDYIYFSANANRQLSLQLLARSSVDFAATASAIRAIAADLDPALVVRVAPLEDNIELYRSLTGLSGTLATALGTLALVLASVGVYGVVAYAVGRRTREIGIRIALGASARSVVALMLKRTMRPVVIGAVIGLAAAVGVSQILSSVLFGVSPVDPLALTAAVLVVAGVAFAAGALPARRAARVDPSTTLHYE